MAWWCVSCQQVKQRVDFDFHQRGQAHHTCKDCAAQVMEQSPRQAGDEALEQGSTLWALMQDPGIRQQGQLQQCGQCGVSRSLEEFDHDGSSNIRKSCTLCLHIHQE
ncbi:hypothetical protein HOY80DRAFT_1002685 [Tuber brumale]|nr:hypothetical protein HOY80DRAFT_1002685 [Tuber brumale]